MKNKNLESIIKYLKFKVTAEAIDTFFENHPSYPSMASVTDAFNVWKIPNAAVGISPEQLSEINLPAIAHLTDNHVEFYVVIQQITEDSIQYYDTEKGLETLSINEFVQKWTGTALLFEPNANSGQREYETAKKEVLQSNIVFNLQIFTALLLVAISGYSLFAESPMFVTLHQCFSLVGLGLSVALLLIEYSNNTDITKKLC
jgi:ABC-type bacteriocin/lantibiotic exporter with double-glycine peptidase domain